MGPRCCLRRGLVHRAAWGIAPLSTRGFGATVSRRCPVPGVALCPPSRGAGCPRGARWAQGCRRSSGVGVGVEGRQPRPQGAGCRNGVGGAEGSRGACGQCAGRTRAGAGIAVDGATCLAAVGAAGGRWVRLGAGASPHIPGAHWGGRILCPVLERRGSGGGRDWCYGTGEAHEGLRPVAVSSLTVKGAGGPRAGRGHRPLGAGCWLIGSEPRRWPPGC